VSADPRRAVLDAEILAWMGEAGWQRDDARFEHLARALFAHQFRHCAPYRRFCEGRGVAPDTLERWEDVPAVPAGAFKELALTCFPLASATHAFRTSGTTAGDRGVLHLDTLALYEASLLPCFRRFLLPDLTPGARAHIVALAPSAVEAPDSSLSHMFAVAIRELGDSESGFWMRDGALDALDVARHLERRAGAAGPLLLCGTAFGFVHLLDALEAKGVSLALPASARLMETGGFKGRSRERPRSALYEQIEATLGIPPQRVVNQYGMTELGSQFYDSVLAEPDAPRRKLGPPWARVRILDPETGAPDALGLVHVFDLANTGSVFAIQTADLGRVVADGFDVVGREPGAEARGCSIAIDALLGR
jgi:hypothetical protein